MASHNSIQIDDKVGKKTAYIEERQRKKRAIDKDRNRFANDEVKILACAHAWKTKKKLFNYAISRKRCLCLMQNSFIAILLAMLISQKTSPKKRNWWKMRFFRYSPAVTKGLKKATNLFQIALFPHKKVKFTHFWTKQVCSVKKKN